MRAGRGGGSRPPAPRPPRACVCDWRQTPGRGGEGGDAAGATTGTPCPALARSPFSPHRPIAPDPPRSCPTMPVACQYLAVHRSMHADSPTVRSPSLWLGGGGRTGGGQGGRGLARKQAPRPPPAPAHPPLSRTASPCTCQSRTTPFCGEEEGRGEGRRRAARSPSHPRLPLSSSHLLNSSTRYSISCSAMRIAADGSAAMVAGSGGRSAEGRPAVAAAGAARGRAPRARAAARGWAAAEGGCGRGAAAEWPHPLDGPAAAAAAVVRRVAARAQKEDLLRVPGDQGARGRRESVGGTLAGALRRAPPASPRQKVRDECVATHGRARGGGEGGGKGPPPPSPLDTVSLLSGPEAPACAALIEAHKVCLRAEGFAVE